MQLPFGFLETTQIEESATLVWRTLEQLQKDEVVAMLARLIAKAALHSHGVVHGEEAHDE